MSTELRAQAERLVADYRAHGERLRWLAAKDSQRAATMRSRRREAQADILKQLLALNNRGGSRIGDMLNAEQGFLVGLEHARHFSPTGQAEQIAKSLRQARAVITGELDFLETIPAPEGAS